MGPEQSPSVVPARAPTWIATGGMTEARTQHTATLLLNGKVLVAGGRIGPNMDGSTTSAELYDPDTRTWSATGTMAAARAAAPPRCFTGKVLVAGGGGRTGCHRRAVRPRQRDLDCDGGHARAA